KVNRNISIVADTSMCSLPTMKFSGALPGWFGAAWLDGGGFGAAFFSRGGPLSFSLWTYKVRTMKNCPLELAISFKTFRASAGAALNVRSITLRFSNSGGVALGSTGFAPRAGLRFRPGAGVAAGAGEAPRSSNKGERRREV